MNSIGIKILISLTFIFCLPYLFTQGIVGNFGDIYQYAAPLRHLAKTSLQSGIIPLWNPYIFAGTPFLASPQSALFYPFSTLFYFFPLNYAFNLFTVLHLFLNGLGMFLLLRYLGRSRSATIFGAVAWSFSSFFLGKCAAGHVIHLSGYSLAPFILLFALRALNGCTRLLTLAFCSLLLGSTLQFFSGHLQVWFHTAILLSFLISWKFFADELNRKIDYFKWIGFFLICFCSLSFIQSLPSFVYLLHSTRFQPTKIFTLQSAYDFATSYSMRWADLIGFFLPNFYGNPMQKNYIDPEHPSVYFETNTIYYGLIPMLFALAGLCIALRKKRFFLPVLSLSFLLLAMGRNSPLYRLIWQGVSFLRVPARFYFLAFAGLLFSSTFFWDELLKHKKTFLKIIIFLVTLADLFLNGRRFIWSEDYLQKIGRSSAMEWLQLRTMPGRVFSSAEVWNPNKTMFFRMENLNGFEAILQKSLINYFAATQGSSAISTTGVDVANPEKNSFRLLGVKYLIASSPLNIKWPRRFDETQLKIYENPNYILPVQPLFSLRKFADTESLFFTLDSQSFNPQKQILQLSRTAQKSEEELPETDVRLLNFRRAGPNRIEMIWKSPETAVFWILLAESYYPGWEVWSESQKKFLPFEANGYLQAIKFFQSKVPVEKVFWIFRPKDFIWGLWLSIFSVIVITVTLFLRSATHF